MKFTPGPEEPPRAFVDELAHELRNILGPIMLSTEALKRMHPLDADAKKAVETIERQTVRLLALVEDLGRSRK